MAHTFRISNALSTTYPSQPFTQKNALISSSLFHSKSIAPRPQDTYLCPLEYESFLCHTMICPQKLTKKEVKSIIQNGDLKKIGNVFVDFASQGDTCMVEFMLKEGVEVDLPNSYGHSALIEVARVRKLTETTKQRLNTLLLQAGADANLKDPAEGMTPLMWYLKRNQPEVAKQFLAEEAKVRIHTEVNFTKNEIYFAEIYLKNIEKKEELVTLISNKIKHENDSKNIKKNKISCSIQ